MNQLIKFPSIEQYRNVVKFVSNRHRYIGKDQSGLPIYDPSIKLPIIDYIGYEKLHGSNVGIIYDRQTNEMHFQSRGRILSIENDHDGFVNFAQAIKSQLYEIFNFISNECVEFDKICIYGEWSRSNDLRLYNKTFIYVFKIAIVTNKDIIWLDHENMNNYVGDVYNDYGIYCSTQFQPYYITIDFNQPETIQDKITELVNYIEENSPIYNNNFKSENSNKQLWGEGIVFSPIQIQTYNDPAYIFKAKGLKHATTKSNNIVSCDPEKLNSINEFVDCVCTENRMNQGIHELQMNGIELCPENTGKFIKWVNCDILKEEKDLLDSNELDWKEVVKYTTTKCKEFWFDKVNII